MGFEVREAASAEECVEAAGDPRVVAVVCEPLLSPGDPAGLVSRLRQKRPDVTVIAHTADTRAELVKALRRAGAAHVLAKPAREELLRAVLAQAVAAGGGGR